MSSRQATPAKTKGKWGEAAGGSDGIVAVDTGGSMDRAEAAIALATEAYRRAPVQFQGRRLAELRPHKRSSARASSSRALSMGGSRGGGGRAVINP